MVNIKAAASYAASQVKKHAKDFKKYPIHTTSKLIDKAIDSTVGEYVSGVADLAKPVAKTVGKSMYKKVDKSIWNGYTGIQESNIAKVTAFGAAGAYVSMAGSYKANTVDKSGNLYDVDNSPTSAAYSKTNAPNLGASGNLVFGLHNGRKG